MKKLVLSKCDALKYSNSNRSNLKHSTYWVDWVQQIWHKIKTALQRIGQFGLDRPDYRKTNKVSYLDRPKQFPLFHGF